MKLSTVLKGLVVVIALVFIGHQLISSVYSPVKTENVSYYTAVEGLKIKGLILRDETVISSENSGVMHFLISDGERVSKGGAIANIYENENASISVSRLDSLKEKIEDIEDVMSYNDVDAVNLDLLKSKVNDRVNEIIISTATGNYINTQEDADALLSALNRKQSALGVNNDFTVQLTALNDEYNSISATLPAAKGSIYAQNSGYFVSKTDGYENVLKVSDLSSITPEFIDSAKPEETAGNIIGKIVSDYEWYIAAKVSINDSLDFKEGDVLKILTPVKTSSELSVTVSRVNISESGSDAVILFYCNQMNSELATLRNAQMTVVKAEHEGLRLPRKALRVVDSKKGVYVLNGMQIDFVPVEIDYYGEDYIICKKETEDKNSVKLYDKVVVKGKKLYDGKIVK